MEFGKWVNFTITKFDCCTYLIANYEKLSFIFKMYLFCAAWICNIKSTKNTGKVAKTTWKSTFILSTYSRINCFYLDLIKFRKETKINTMYNLLSIAYSWTITYVCFSLVQFADKALKNEDVCIQTKCLLYKANYIRDFVCFFSELCLNHAVILMQNEPVPKIENKTFFFSLQKIRLG